MDPLMLLGLYALIQSRKKNQPNVRGTDAPTAFLYQLPEDSFTTTRLAVSTGGDDPKEVGIFGSPDKALAVAQSSGYAVSHGGQVLQLKTKPGA